MSTLLEMRENLRNFYSKYEVYITPVLKFLLALVVFLMINNGVGYMSWLTHIIIVLMLALMCSFLPTNFIVIIGAFIAILHMYELSIEAALVVGGVFLIMFLLYFRFAPKDTLVVALLPLCFILKIPYVVPIAAALLGSVTSVVSVSCGVIVYYMLAAVRANATTLTGMEGSENMIARFRLLVDALMADKQMMVTVVVFAMTTLIVYFIRRLRVDYAWTIAICCGCVFCAIAMLIGMLRFNADMSTVGIVIGTIVSGAFGMVFQFFFFNVDYSRTEYVQFEDDEYYYYVKAVPKNNVTKANKKVKKITSVL